MRKSASIMTTWTKSLCNRIQSICVHSNKNDHAKYSNGIQTMAHLLRCSPFISVSVNVFTVVFFLLWLSSLFGFVVYLSLDHHYDTLKP